MLSYYFFLIRETRSKKLYVNYNLAKSLTVGEKLKNLSKFVKIVHSFQDFPYFVIIGDNKTICRSVNDKIRKALITTFIFE